MTAAEKQLVEATIAAKDQTILVLTDVIDHLRILLAERPAVANPLPGPATERIDFDEVPDRLHMSEEEEDIQFMFANGHLTEEQRDAALQQVGAVGPLSLVQ